MDAHTVPLVTAVTDPHVLDPGPRLDHLADVGKLVRVRRGVYVEPEAWHDGDHRHSTVLRARAAQHRATRPLTFSHVTAAHLLGLPIVACHDRRLHVIDLGGGVRRSRQGIVWRGTTHPERVECAEVSGLTLTSSRQTALDLARVESALTAFIVADAVAAATPDSAELRQWWAMRLDELGPARGTRRAARVLGLVTGLAESPLESLSLLRMHELGFATPEQQRVVTTHRGVFRLDFSWLDGAIGGEADGRGKYNGLESPAEMEQRLWEEKLRHDAVRATLRAYPRWIWDDAWYGHGLERRLIEAGVPRPRSATRLSF